jgi:hypothetical protein
MGAELVGLVLVRWTHVSDRAFRILIRMALTALDSPKDGNPAATYRGGRDLLAMSLRTDKGTLETRYRAVKRAIAELSEAGAIQHIHGGWAGQRAVYRLTLQGARAIDADPSVPERKGGQIDPPKGGRIDPPVGGLYNVERGASETPPRNHEEPIQERGQEESVDLQPSCNAPRATASDPAEPISPPLRPARCPHGFAPKARPDGRPACALCRVAEDRPATALPDGHMADVIPLRAWEAS